MLFTGERKVIGVLLSKKCVYKIRPQLVQCKQINLRTTHLESTLK